MSLSEATWAEIARLWREGREPLGSLAERFGMSRQRLVATARKKEWGSRTTVPAPSQSAERPSGSRSSARVIADRAPSGPRRKPKKAKSRDRSLQSMVERLFDAMETKLSVIEQRLAEGGDETSADSERTARSIGTLIRNLERLSEYERKLIKAQSATGKDTEGERDDTERRRQELAQRIARLLERR